MPDTVSGAPVTLPRAGVLELLKCLAGRRRVARVQGRSMLPHLAPEDAVLFDPRAYRRAAPRPGDVVVAEAPEGGKLLVKRVAPVPPGHDAGVDNGVWVLGENRGESTDSRSFGALAATAVRGRVTALIRG